jgi:hypothetical protein
MNPFGGAQRMYPVPPIRDEVEKAISADKLKEFASNVTEPEILLGLALLAQAGNPIRKELLNTAVQAKADLAPVAAVLPLMLDGVDESAVRELIERDPDNALGYYLQGNLLYQSNRESLDSFRKAGRCAEMRFYDATTADALFKTTDALELKGEDRLCALGWMAARISNFSSCGLQALRNSLSELAAKADLATRKEISDLLLVLAGHLYATNYVNRWFGERAIESALQLKAEIAAVENSPTMYGYGAATQVSFHSICSWPGFENLPKPLQLAQHLPSRIYRAFAMVDPSKFNPRYIGELNFSVTESNRAAFEEAKANVAKTARALLDLALTDPDGVIGAYLRGIPSQRDGKNPWFPPGTLVGKLMLDKPELLRAAAANEEAMMALWKLNESDPEQQNISRMMKIAWAISHYASAHENIYPPDLDVLFKEGHLNPPIEPKSLLTGRPYIYVAAGQKRPAKSAELFETILLYDDHPVGGGYVPGVLASCGGGHVPLKAIQEQLRKRGNPIA